MSKAEYFAVFESLLYGLALAHILVSFSKMIMHRRSIKLYWVHLTFVFAGILGLAQRYYSGYHGPEYEHVNSPWTFFLLIMLPMAVYFVLAYQFFPETIKDTNFKTFFWSKYQEIVLVFISFSIVIVARNIFIDIYSIRNGSLDRATYFSSPEFLVFAGAILFLAIMGSVAVILKKKWIVKLLAVLALFYCLFIMSA